MSKAVRAKVGRHGGQVTALKYGIEYMRQLGRKGGLRTQVQLREESNGEESEGV
jgi:general stress protein YciG